MGRPTKFQRFDADKFIAAIKAEMKARNVSHEALAKQTGLSLWMVSRMRRENRRPTTDTFLALCHWLGTDPMQFHVEMKDAPKQTTPFSGLMR